jgi:hypothetical protein
MPDSHTHIHTHTRPTQLSRTTRWRWTTCTVWSPPTHRLRDGSAWCARLVKRGRVPVSSMAWPCRQPPPPQARLPSTWCMCMADSRGLTSSVCDPQFRVSCVLMCMGLHVNTNIYVHTFTYACRHAFGPLGTRHGSPNLAGNHIEKTSKRV